jgi:uncharacterized protein YjiS (DUF1127 family)
VARRSPEPKPERTPEEWADLRRRAEAYDVEALSELTYLHHDIDDIGIEEGDLGARAERAVIQLATTTLRDEAALDRRVAQMRRDLDGPAPSPTECLLVDCVVTCWVHLNYLGELWARAMKDGSVATQKHIDHLLDRAQSRFLSAQKTLAQVRRLIVPVVQLNMANQQVNVVVGSSDG